MTLNVTLFENANSENTIHRSKAVGEPPLMLGISAFMAISDAVSSCGDGFGGSRRSGHAGTGTPGRHAASGTGLVIGFDRIGLREAVRRHGTVARIVIVGHKGSTPRETGVSMAGLGGRPVGNDRRRGTRTGCGRSRAKGSRIRSGRLNAELAGLVPDRPMLWRRGQPRHRDF